MPSAVIPSVHSYAALRLAPQQLHQRYVHPGPLVLGTDPLNSPTPTADRDRTVSRRYESSSCTTLIRQQPYPLAVERWPFHAGPPDLYVRLSSLLDLSVSQSGRLMPLHSTSDFRPL